jgi:hypothetical protein
MKKSLVLSCILSFLMLGFAHAQEMKAKKFDNPEWKYISFLKFKAGKSDRAHEIIKNYFEKSAQKASVPSPSLVVDLMTGEWDMMVVWSLKGGVEDLNWEVSPDDAKWMSAMNEIAGGAGKGKAILDEFSDLIARESRYLGKNTVVK